MLASALVVIALVDLFTFGSGYNATVKKADLYPDTPGLDAVRALLPSPS